MRIASQRRRICVAFHTRMRRPARKAHPGLLVSDIEAWAARLGAAGYPVAFDDEFPGMRRFYSEDPHGNRLEFLEPLEAIG